MEKIVYADKPNEYFYRLYKEYFGFIKVFVWEFTKENFAVDYIKKHNIVDKDIKYYDQKGNLIK